MSLKRVLSLLPLLACLGDAQPLPPPSTGGAGGVYCNATGGASNTLVCTPSPAITSYTAGMVVSLKVDASNTGATTLNVNGKGAKSIFQDGAALASGVLVAGSGTGDTYALYYDGTRFNMASGITGPDGPPGTLGTVITYSGSHTVTASDCGNTLTSSAVATFTLPITITGPCQIYVINSAANAGAITMALSGGATYNGGTTPLPTFAPSATTTQAGQVFTETSGGNWVGAAGPTGLTGSGYLATSTTSLVIGTGTKTFTTQSGLAYTAGQTAGAYSAADTSNFMVGIVTSYSGTTLVLSISLTGGSGTHTDWGLGLATLSGGTPCTTGSGTAIQYNSSGSFGCLSGSSVSGANVTLGGSVTAGANGRIIMTQDGAANGYIAATDNVGNGVNVGGSASNQGYNAVVGGAAYAGSSATAANVLIPINQGAIQLIDKGTSIPACSATTRNLEWPTQGASGTADAWQWCGKNQDNTYAWKGTLPGNDLTGQSAAITGHSLATPVSTGMYRVSYTAKVTTAGTTSVLGGTTGFVLNYTDGADSVAQNLTLTESNQAGAILAIGTGNVTNTTGTILYGSAVVYAKAAVAMTYDFGYASTGTTMVYELHVRVEGI